MLRRRCRAAGRRRNRPPVFDWIWIVFNGLGPWLHAGFIVVRGWRDDLVEVAGGCGVYGPGLFVMLG